MIIGVKGLTWAKVKSGGDGSAMVYEDGAYEKDRMVRVDQNEERAEAVFHADDHSIDRDNSVTGATIAIEMARMTDGMRTGMLGHVKEAGNNGAWHVTDAEAPYVGTGFYLVDRYKGEKKWRAFWYWKVQFSEGSRSFNTRGESLEFQTESADGEAMGVQLTENGAYEYYAYVEVSSEADAVAWLKEKAGITDGE